MKQSDPAKCRICLNLDKCDRGLLNFNKKCKAIRKFKYNEVEMTKVCNCSLAHKFCILKLIMVSQCLVCPHCNESYKINFVDNSSFCKRLITYKFLGELLFVIMSVFASIALIFTNGFYNYSSAFWFWRQVVFVILCILIVFCCLIIFKMLHRMNNEKFVESIRFNEQIESKSSIIKPLNLENNDHMINLKSRDSIIQFIDNKNIGKHHNRVKKENNDQEKLKYVFGILMSDFGMSKKEILQLKVENSNMISISRKQDFTSQISLGIGSIIKPNKSKEALKLVIEKKPTSISGKKLEDIFDQAQSACAQSPIQIKNNLNSNSKMLVLQDDMTQNIDNNNATTNIDLGCTINRLPYNTQDFIRLTSENSVFDRSNDNRELVLNISEDESFKLHKREIKTPFNLTSNESGIFLNQSKDILIQ